MSGSIVQSLKFWDRAMNATTSSPAISVSGANQFVFDVKKFPGCEVVDLR